MNLPFRRRDAAPPSPVPPAAGQADRFAGLTPMRIDYDEARCAEDRTTYHQPRLIAPGEFIADVHPVARLKAFRGRRDRTR